MAKLGSKKRPIILRASTRVDGERAMRICEEHGWHYIVGFEPDKRQDFSDLDKALRSLASPSPALEERELSGIMIPLVEVLPDLAHRETRCIIILHDDGPLPRGEYGFVELYCADDACDCRRVLVHVFHGPESPRLVATINHGFDEPSPDDGDLRTFLDPLGAQGELADEVLDTFETILLRDPVYVRRLESHYALFKEAVGDEGTRRRLVAPRGVRPAIRSRVRRRKRWSGQRPARSRPSSVTQG